MVSLFFPPPAKNVTDWHKKLAFCRARTKLHGQKKQKGVKMVRACHRSRDRPQPFRHNLRVVSIANSYPKEK